MLPAFPQRRNLVAPARHDNDPDDPDPEAKYVPGSKRKYNRIMLLRILLVAPGPAFAIFCLINRAQSQQQWPGGYTGRFVQTDTAVTVATLVWFCSTPLVVLCLFLSQLHQHVKSRIWTATTVIEWGVYLVSVWIYGAIVIDIETRPINYLILFIVNNCFFVAGVILATKTIHSIKLYQEQHRNYSYPNFVAALSVRILVASVGNFLVLLLYLGADMRIMISSQHEVSFRELSARGTSCSHDEFLEAFAASSANASCSDVPLCGYARWEDLCLAVQYSDLKSACSSDARTIVLFVAATLILHVVITGSGRARHSAHLLSRTLAAAATIVVALFLNCLFSTARLLLTLPQLHQPRSAAYFETADTMHYELPLMCYDSCGNGRFWGMIALYGVLCFLINFDFISSICGYDRSEKLERLLRTEAEQALEQRQQWEKKMAGPAEAAVEEERQAAACTFWFVDADFVKSSLLTTLPKFQALQAIQGALHSVTIKFDSALAQEMAQNEFCIVSHRWFDPSEPDQDGTQFRTIQEYLRSRPTVKYVWFDFWCMPQGPRTPSEKVYFKWMLENINVLYLSVSVLILLDLSYISRFWTQYEAWLSMQTATKDGLRPATEAQRRCEIRCIYTATQNMAEALTAIWATKTPAEAFATLAKPDVTVTNESDKEQQLPKILTFDDRVRKANLEASVGT